MITETLLKTDGTTITLTALPDGKIKVSCLAFDEPKVMLKGEIFQVRSDGKALLLQRVKRGFRPVVT